MLLGTNSTQKAAEEVLEAWYYIRHWRRVVLEAWYYTRHWRRVVLEAWYYTRAAGTEVIHVAATEFQGIPDCVARYNSPRMWRRLAQYQRLRGASISKGRCHHGVINLHFVYTLVTVLVCL